MKKKLRTRVVDALALEPVRVLLALWAAAVVFLDRGAPAEYSLAFLGSVDAGVVSGLAVALLLYLALRALTRSDMRSEMRGGVSIS